MTLSLIIVIDWFMKLKTRKTISKRFQIKKRSGKVFKRVAGQNHFNSNERGKTTRLKRKEKGVMRTEYKVIKRSV